MSFSQPNIPDDRVKDVKQLVEFASELQDTEVRKLAQVIAGVSAKFSQRLATPDNLEAMRDEILTKLAKIGILATVDPTPVFYGEPPTVEIVGRIGGTEQAVHGLDHERKMYEVKKAVSRGEDWLGQKESPDSAPIKKRYKNDKAK